MLTPPRQKLLYLGFAFPPSAPEKRHGINPAGHLLETQMIHELRRHYDLRSAGMLPFSWNPDDAADPSSGLPHDLLLVDKAPEVWHRLGSLRLLKRRYLQWQHEGWRPDHILVYNLSPVYNAFLLWLKRSFRNPPRLLLLFVDSSQLGSKISALKKLRHRFKPLVYGDEQMLDLFDGLIGWSKNSEFVARSRSLPFLWIPGGCDPSRAVSEAKKIAHPVDGPLTAGYFGSLAPHAGVTELLEGFTGVTLPVRLKFCGYGKQTDAVIKRVQNDSRVQFCGLLSPLECLDFALGCDLLINPRPLGHGNENNFPSKVFEYALTGRSIMTTGFAGVREVLGEEAFYLDETRLVESIGSQLNLRPKKWPGS